MGIRMGMRELTAPQELQVLSLWPEAPHLGQSVPCMLADL